MSAASVDVCWTQLLLTFQKDEFEVQNTKICAHFLNDVNFIKHKFNE